MLVVGRGNWTGSMERQSSNLSINQFQFTPNHKRYQSIVMVYESYIEDTYYKFTGQWWAKSTHILERSTWRITVFELLWFIDCITVHHQWNILNSNPIIGIRPTLELQITFIYSSPHHIIRPWYAQAVRYSLDHKTLHIVAALTKIFSLEKPKFASCCDLRAQLWSVVRGDGKKIMEKCSIPS